MEVKNSYPARQNDDFGQNFHLFSTHFLPIFRLWYAIRCFSAHMFTDYAYFRLFSTYFHLFFTYFPPVVPHPYYKLKHVTHLPFFCPHVYGFRLFSAYFPPIFCLKFCLFSAHPVLPGNRILTLLSQS